LFVVAPEGNLFTASHTPATGWSCLGDKKYWQPLGQPGGYVFDPGVSDMQALVPFLSNNMEVFITGTDGQIYHTRWDDEKMGWLGWSQGPAGFRVGWDCGVGGVINTANPFPHGFHFTAVDKLSSSLAVLAVNSAGVIVVTECQGAAMQAL
jgi:hypothetical protein